MDRVGERRHVIVEFTPDVQPGATIQVNGEDWVFDSEAGYTPGGCTRCAAFAHLPKPPLGVRLEVWWGIRDKKAGGALVVTGLDTKGDPRCANVRPFNGTFKRP